MRPLAFADDGALLCAHMLPVHITVAVGSRAVPVDELSSGRLSSALRTAGEDIARRLAAIRCPVHDVTARNVCVHFDARGNADLKYESCCEGLGDCVGERF